MTTDLSYLRTAYGGKFGGKAISDWADVVLSERYPPEGIGRRGLGKFLEDKSGCPARYIRLDTPQIRYRNHLRDSYRSIAAVNSAFGTSFASFDAAELPVTEANWTFMKAERSAIKRDFIVRNYRTCGLSSRSTGRLRAIRWFWCCALWP